MKLGRLSYPVVFLLLGFVSTSHASPVRIESFLGAPASALTANDSLPTPPDPLPPGVVQVGTWPPKPCGTSEVSMLFSACTCNLKFLDAGSDAGGVFVKVEIHPEVVCIWCAPDSVRVSLGTLAPGYHTAAYRIEATIIHADGTAEHETRYGSLSFDVARECPPPNEFPFVQSAVVLGRVPCDGCPPVVCAGDSIRVLLSGYLPDTCHRFEGIELIPPPYGSPLPYPPVVRAKFGMNSCIDIACALVITPWNAQVTLPPLPERDYTLMAEAALEDHCDGTVEVVQRLERPFAVGGECGACFRSVWVDDLGHDDRCDAQVSRDEPAVVRLAVETSASLAGLQGKLRFHLPNLEIQKIEAIGSATGFALHWTKADQGADFVLFSLDGRVILGERGPQEILAITCGAKPGVEIPPVTHLNLFDAIGADPEGDAVFPCPEIALWLQVGAVICRVVPCDVNGDGTADVRDLVSFVNCVRDPASCPDPERADVDCDGDGGVDLDDVMCCARTILYHELPDSIPARFEPSVALTLGAPVRTAAGYDVEVTLHGADRIGAARLALGYPQGGFDVSSVEFPDAGSEWLAMHEAGDEGLLLGWIGLTEPNGPASVRAIVHLSTASATDEGGVVMVKDIDLAGRDGVPLVAPASDVSFPLSPRLVMSLSAPRPNPFLTVTSFTLTANEDVEVEVSVFDLAGRVVTTLHRGPMAAGQLTLVWNGAADGTQLRSGLYFVRARSGDAVAQQRVVVLGGEGYRVPLE